MIIFRKPKTRGDWITLALGLVFVAFPALSILHGIESLSWTRTDGVVTYSSPKRGTHRYVVDIRYRYSYAGRDYTGDRYRFQFLLTREQAESKDVDNIQGRYPVGEPVKVAIDSSDPGRSVLEPGPDLEDLIPLAFGVLLLFVSIGERRSAAAASPVVTGATIAKNPNYRTAKWLAALGAVGILYGATELYKGWSSLSWPTVQGKVFHSSARTGSNPVTQLWYEYYVGGTRYVADKYRTGGNSTPFDDVAKAAAQRYAEGNAVTVYYNPADPAVALLEPGIWYGNFIIPGIGLLLLVASWVAKKVADAVTRLRTQ